MAEAESIDSPWLGGLVLGVVLGAVVTLVGAGLEGSALFGIGLTRVGQVLFVAAFLSGGMYCVTRDQNWRAAGLVVIAVGWALLIVDGVLRALLGSAFIQLVVAVLVLGCGLVLVGLIRDGLREAPATGAETEVGPETARQREPSGTEE
jgi:hypothetical protein